MTTHTDIEKIVLADMDAWDVFATDNRDALIEQYGSTAKALQHALQGGLRMGGGAAPITDICFADDIDSDGEQYPTNEEMADRHGTDARDEAAAEQDACHRAQE